MTAEKDRCRNQENLAKKRLRILNPENLTVKEFAAYRARLDEAQACFPCCVHSGKWHDTSQALLPFQLVLSLSHDIVTVQHQPCILPG